MNFLELLLFMAATTGVTSQETLNFLELGGVPFDAQAAAKNTHRLSQLLTENASNHRVLFPEKLTFYFHHGVYAKNIQNSILQIDGTLRFERSDEPIDHSLSKHDPFPSCFMIDKSYNVTLTSKTRGVLDGRGAQWWGVPLLGYLKTAENRPRLLRFNETTNLLIENLVLQDSPFHSLYLETVRNVEVRDVSIVARRTAHDGHGLIDLTAFNTDGIDVSGKNVWVHDVDIWVQDDCIAVKDSIDFESSDMVFERVNASGMGLTIGSIQVTHVRNITFRDSYLHRTVKGLYMKFSKPNQVALDRSNGSIAVIEDIVYENITMEEPLQWPIWIGPAQQADATNICHPNPCSLCWPTSPSAKCHIVPNSKFRGITLRNIQINNPHMATGVILGNLHNEIEDLVFDNVIVTQGKLLPFAKEDRTITFPGLLQSIDDPFVPGSFAREKNIVDYVNPLDWLKALHLDHEAQTWLGMIESWAVWIDDVSSLLLWTLIAGYVLVISLLVRSLRLRFSSDMSNPSIDELSLVPDSENILQEPLIPSNQGKNYRSRAATEDTTPLSPGMDLEDDAASQGSELPFTSAEQDALFTITEESTSGQGTTEPLRQRPTFLVAVLIFLTAVTFALTTDAFERRWPWNKHKWERTNRYYVCKGVSGGIAKGDTWPVPSCLKRESKKLFDW